MSNSICSENRGRRARREDAFFTRVSIWLLTESSINLDIQVYLHAIIMHWVIVRWNTPSIRNTKSGRRCMWWLISHPSTWLEPVGRFWHLSREQRKHYLSKNLETEQAEGLAVKKRILSERNTLEQLPFLITVPHFRLSLPSVKPICEVCSLKMLDVLMCQEKHLKKENIPPRQSCSTSRSL